MPIIKSGQAKTWPAGLLAPALVKSTLLLSSYANYMSPYFWWSPAQLLTKTTIMVVIYICIYMRQQGCNVLMNQVGKEKWICKHFPVNYVKEGDLQKFSVMNDSWNVLVLRNSKPKSFMLWYTYIVWVMLHYFTWLLLILVLVQTI